MDVKDGAEIERMVLKKTMELRDGYLNSLLFGAVQGWKVIIEDSARVQTACMGLLPSGEYAMKFGKKFLEQDVRSETELYFVYLHELFHMINGDLLRACPPAMSGRGFREYNILFDIKINSSILRNHYKDGWYFLDEFYGRNADKALAFLLHPAFTREELEGDRIYNDNSLQERAREMAETAQFVDGECIKDRKEFAGLYVDAWFKNASINTLMKRMMKV
ncbi:MAG TPA: hypothetical protein P5511_10305, partial [Candidatus Goldiibacteriota bacterium]|nr:hypothetical protein [Candidatus Goldiibacteriota bacterium]